MRALAIVALLAGSANAGGIALEAYTGDRPADAARLMSPVLDELAARGFASGDTIARSYEGKVSRAAETPAGLPADFAKQVEVGFKAWVAGRFDDAIKTLAPLVEAAHANSGLVAKDQTLREPLLRALIALALAQQRNGDPASMHATFLEILHGYPDAQVPRAMYGAEAFDLFEQARREVGAAGKGKLTVEVGEGAVVFVDELYRAVGTTTLELAPGEYRVCVLADKRPSRSHRVVVRANDGAKLAIDAGLDHAIHTNAWTGLDFATTAEREAHEGPYAAQVATAIGATAVAVVGIDSVRGRPAVVGSLVSLSTGREIRRASVAMEPDPSTERLKALARYLAGEEPAAGLDVQTPATAAAKIEAPPPREEPARASRSGGWKWLAGGGAVVALGAGGYLAYEDGRCQDTPMPGRMCNNVYAYSPADYVVLGAGVALAGVAVYLFATGDSRAPFVAPAAGGAVAGFAGSF